MFPLCFFHHNSSYQILQGLEGHLATASANGKAGLLMFVEQLMVHLFFTSVVAPNSAPDNFGS